MKHLFVISAYGESPYLEDCIASLENQTGPGGILLCTSTPSDYLKHIADAHHLPYHVRCGSPSLKDDWNFCARTAREAGADLLTIAHQDDVYLPCYLENVTNAFRKSGGKASLIFTAAGNIDAYGKPVEGKAEKVKRLLRRPLQTPLKKTVFGRRLSLAYGNSIPCPACTYNLAFAGEDGTLFTSDSRFVIDWMTLKELAEKEGSFEYVKEPGIRIRLHDGQETARTMKDETRQTEELGMFKKFHTDPVAKLLMRFYRKSSDVYDKRK